VEGRVVGCVQLLPAKLPNGAHRAEVAKLLVHRSARGRGVATALMAHLEREALAQGRWLLQLDTETGSAAEDLYLRRGWQRLGVLPDHAVRPEGVLAPTTFLWKRLSP
jgi:GNAT superfamily N-acetyltransferase